jgi:hypothetical protein
LFFQDIDGPADAGLRLRVHAVPASATVDDGVPDVLRPRRARLRPDLPLA